jgi:preprotein translocase subunit YajC
MRHREIVVWLGVVAIALGVSVARAQAPTQPAGGEGKPKLESVPTEKAPGAGASQPPAGPPAAEDANAAKKPPPPKNKNNGGIFGNTIWFYVILLGGFVLLYVWMGRSRRKQAARRKEMLAALKKGDKIVSIGGIVGTVIEARPEEVTVKVDETNNVRMKFARWAIRGVGEEAKSEKPEDRK